MSETTYFRFNPTGEIFPLTERFMLPELLWAEKYLEVDMALALTGSRSAVSMFLILRRTDPRRWTVQAFAEIATDDFEILQPDHADHPDHPDNGQGQADEPDPTEESAPADESQTVTR